MKYFSLQISNNRQFFDIVNSTTYTHTLNASGTTELQNMQKQDVCKDHDLMYYSCN